MTETATKDVVWAPPQAATTRPDTTQAELDKALDELAAAKDRWPEVDLPERVFLLERLLRDCEAVGPAQVEAARQAKGLTPDDPRSGEEWLAGPLILHRNLRLFAKSLRETHERGRPQVPGPITTRPDGQVVAQVFPDGLMDKVLFAGLTAEVWMEPGVTLESLPSTMAKIYQRGVKTPGKVALVLGAGNVASIGPTDVLSKLFVENQVCILKMNPVNEYLGPFVERGFRALIERGLLRVVYGGAAVGQYLCAHPKVEEIHITGSDKTHDAIVWGPPGPERDERKKNKKPLLSKPITSELGNVSPVVVIPGPWSQDDIEFHALNVASQVQNNGSFNCNAAKLVVQHKGWDKRAALMDAIRRQLKSMPPRRAYYPGAMDRYKAFVAAHPEAEVLGARADGAVPWTLIPDVDPKNPRDVCFSSEAFCGILAETALEAPGPIDFLEQAVRFLNDVVWGTLNCCLLVHPKTMADPKFKAAFEHALGELRYGTIGINYWPAVGYGLVSTTWGAFPGHPLEDIQSGRGFVHNAYLFDRPQKSVVRGPFRTAPLPPWFYSNKKTHELGPKLASFETGPGVLKLPSLFWSALRG